MIFAGSVPVILVHVAALVVRITLVPVDESREMNASLELFGRVEIVVIRTLSAVRTCAHASPASVVRQTPPLELPTQIVFEIPFTVAIAVIVPPSAMIVSLIEVQVAVVCDAVLRQSLFVPASSVSGAFASATSGEIHSRESPDQGPEIFVCVVFTIR